MQRDGDGQDSQGVYIVTWGKGRRSQVKAGERALTQSSKNKSPEVGAFSRVGSQKVQVSLLSTEQRWKSQVMKKLDLRGRVMRSQWRSGFRAGSHQRGRVGATRPDLRCRTMSEHCVLKKKKRLQKEQSRCKESSGFIKRMFSKLIILLEEWGNSPNCWL